MSKRTYLKRLASRLIWSGGLIAIAIGLDIFIETLNLKNIAVGIILFIGGWLLIGWKFEENDEMED